MVVAASILLVAVAMSYGNKSRAITSKSKTIHKKVASSLAKEKFEFYNVLPNAEVTTTAKKQTTKIGKENYIVQLAAFKNIEQAEKLTKTLDILSFKSNIRSVKITENDIWYHVYVGPFNKETIAKQEQTKLIENKISDGLVLKVDI